jgi:2-oxoglutarate dehydrogenase E2 component (dihydrolipoamide succinyltransferase)
VPDDAPRRERGATRATPVVARIAAEHNIDLSTVKGTGRGGRVRKQDVLALVDGDGAQAAPAEPPLHIESPYRPEPAPAKPAAAAPAAAVRSAAPRGRAAVPHAPLDRRAHEALARARRALHDDRRVRHVRRRARRRELGSTYLPIVARCTVEALREFGDLNAWLEGETFTRHEAVPPGHRRVAGQTA